MRNHFIKEIGLSIVLMGVTMSCNDFLDKQPLSSIADTNFWKNENDAKLALVGCYRVQPSWQNHDFQTSSGLLYLDFAGGNGTDKEGSTFSMAGTSTNSSNWPLSEYWMNAYAQIAQYNTFLDNIENCPMDGQKKKVWAAEVQVLRAYSFFNLAFYFQNVPMPLTSLTVEEANTISQTSQADIYNQIEKELKEVIEILPLKQSNEDYGRVTKGVAKVLLSRVYLAKNDYVNASSILQSIIADGVYELDKSEGRDSYEKLFQIGGEYSSEIIFFTQRAKDLYVTAWLQYLYPECYGGWHQYSVYNELVREYFCVDGKSIEDSPLYNEEDPYVNRDIRLYASVFMPPLGTFEGQTYNGVTYDCFNGANTNDSYNRYTRFNGYCPKKGFDPSVLNSNLLQSYEYTPIFRYAEVLLSYLEAVNEASPSSVTQALPDLTINDVRDRVGLPPYSMVDLSSQDIVREAVRKERRVELAFEGLRYFDILRWGTASELLNHTFTGVKLSDNPDDRNYRGAGSTASAVDENLYYQFEKREWAPYNRYFPIPQGDMNINKNLIQNDGY